MARYDYGLRGPRDTMAPRFGRGARGYAMDFDHRGSPGHPSPRISRPYNVDYVRPDRDGRPLNPYPYGGEWRGQMGNEEMYRMPYQTRGGTSTSRGVPRPNRYDYPNYGPSYGGRYPDEL